MSMGATWADFMVGGQTLLQSVEYLGGATSRLGGWK